MKKRRYHKPPAWIHFILRKRLNEDALEEVLGDLHELYARWADRSGVFIAQLRYILHVLFFLRPLPEGLNKKPLPKYLQSKPTINTAMFYSSLKIAWRQLLNNKGYAMINIGGLAVGMGVVLMIGLWVWDELSFDRNHKNHDRLTQVWQMVNFDGNNSFYNSVPVPIAQELRSKYPEVEASSVTTNIRDFALSKDDKKLMRAGIFAEPAFPGMLTLDMIDGDRAGLNDMQTVLLSQSSAKAFFFKRNSGWKNGPAE